MGNSQKVYISYIDQTKQTPRKPKEMTAPRKHIPTSTTTRYEVALIRNGNTVHVYGYTARKSVTGIYAVIQGENVEGFFNEDELIRAETFEGKRKGCIAILENVWIGFTGKTERDAQSDVKGING